MAESILYFYTCFGSISTSSGMCIFNIENEGKNVLHFSKIARIWTKYRIKKEKYKIT